MKKVILVLLALLVAAPVFARGIAQELPTKNRTGYRLAITDDLAVSATGYQIGEAFPGARFAFTIGSDFIGKVWGCDTAAFAAATCDDAELLDISNANVAGTGFTARRFYVLTVATDEGAGTTSWLEVKGSDSQVAAAVDPSYTVRFESAALTDDPRVYAYSSVRLVELCCVTTEGTDPTAHQVGVYECSGTTGESCVDSGLQVIVDDLDTVECSTTITDNYIDAGDMWGIFTESFTLAADALDCTIHAERG
jgi:hypothetical protein